MKSVVHILIFTVVFCESKLLPKFMQDLRCPLTHDFKPCFIEKGNAAIPLLAKGKVCQLFHTRFVALMVQGVPRRMGQTSFEIRGHMGVPDYNIPKMNPAVIQHVPIISTESMILNLTYVTVYGLEDMKIVDIDVDLKTRKFRTTLSGENITVVGHYGLDGNILLIPLKNEGHFRAYLKNGIYIATKIDYIIEKHGEKYYNPVFDPLEYDLEKVEFKIDGLLGGDKGLENSVNRLINKNWDVLMEGLGPGIAGIMSKIITDIFENLAAVVPVKNVFLDDPVFKFEK